MVAILVSQTSICTSKQITQYGEIMLFPMLLGRKSDKNEWERLKRKPFYTIPPCHANNFDLLGVNPNISELTFFMQSCESR